MMSREWTVDKLMSLSIPEVERLYRILPPPSFEEMHGEYQGGYIGCEHPISNYPAPWGRSTLVA